MDRIKFTGERFVPGIEDEMLEIEHMQRYYAVRKLVEGKKVLDVASGEGYGSNILASTAKEVVGVDISEEAVENATKIYGKKQNLAYKVGSIAQLPFEDHSFDMIVSFETIEHVSEELQNDFLTEAKRVLKEDGIFIISTPNKEIYSDRYEYHNEYHVKEFYIDEFISFLKKEFSNVKLFNQYFEVASVIDSANQIGEASYKRSKSYQALPKYVIAVAGNVDISGYEVQSVQIGSKVQYLEQMDRIIALQNGEESRNQHIAHLDAEIEEKNSYIKILQKEVADRDFRIEEQNRTYEQYRVENENQVKRIFQIIERDIQNKNRELEDYKAGLVEKERQIQEIQDEKEAQLQQMTAEKEAELREKEAQLQQMTAEKEAQIQQIQSESEHAKSKIALLEQEVRNKCGHIEQLLDVERAFEREKNTRMYKLSLVIRKAVGIVLPSNSRREFLVYLLMQLLRHPVITVKTMAKTGIKSFLKADNTEKMIQAWERYYKNRAYIVNGAEAISGSIQNNESVKISESVKINEPEPRKDYPVLNFATVANPTVSIIIPVYNQFDYTYNCLESILKNSDNVSYEIIIGDDCSTDNTKDMDKFVKGIQTIHNEKNLRFLLNCNNAASYAKGKYILFLNNDTTVKENWLEPLVTLIESDKTIGMVGSKLLYPDGTLQEAGGILWKDGSAWNYGNRQDANASEFNYVREVDYISGAAIMIRSTLWEEIGGFDTAFVPAYCEDSDLAFEVRKHGYKVMYQPKSEVVHYEGISNGTDLNQGQKKYQVDNQKKFLEKWKDELEKNHFENGTNVFVARDRSRFKKHVLVVDHYVPHYDKDAGSKTTFMYLKQMLRMGLHVTFLGDNFYQHEPYTTTLQQLGILVLYGPHYAQNWQSFIKDNAEYFDYFYLNRPHITTKYIDFVKENTNGKIIYYGHDLHFLREQRQYELEGDEKYLESSKHWKEIEFDIYSKSDAIYVPGSYEQAYLSELVKDVPVRNLPAYIYEQEKPNVNMDFDTREGILFVGGFGHPPNEGAVLWFAKKVFPKIVEKIPSIKWYIVGSKVTPAIEELASDNIIILGFVSDERLEEIYNECRIVIVPLLVGAGVKGKVVEAVYNRTPMVTTSVGAEGLSTEEGAFLVRDGVDEMASAVIELYNDVEALRVMSENCKVFIEKYFTPKSAEAILRMDMDV